MGHRSAEPPLSDAAQGYLLALRSITGDGSSTMVSALARRMGVSTQAASEMVTRLAGEGLVETSSDRALTLTTAGRTAADAIFRRHALLEWLLIKVIGLGWAESDEEAARLQGAVSARVVDRIGQMLGDPPTCPHGNPISEAIAARRPPGIPLSDAKPGTDITIYRITEEAEEDVELLTYLEKAELVPGTHARVVDVSTGRDAITLLAPSGTASIGLRPARLVRVLPGQADETLFHRVPERLERRSLVEALAG